MKSGKTLKALLTVVAATAFAAGCGNDGGSAGTTLNTTQMQAYSQEMSAAVSGGITSSGAFTFNAEPDHHHHPLNANPGHEQPESTGTASATVSCSAGGTSTVTGSLSYTMSGSTLNISALTFTVVFTGCEHVGADGVTYTINTPSGGITVDASGSFTSNSGEVSGNLSLTEIGTVDVTGTNLSATCSINITATDTETNNASTVDVTGTACGNTINTSFSS